MTVHPNLKRLSNSAVNLLETCPRLFELDRLAPSYREDGENVHLDFGTVVGSLVQDYLVSGSVEVATWNAFLRYPRALFEEEIDEEEHKHQKDFWYALYALDKFIPFRQEELGEYTVAILDGKPAVELGFTISCPDGFSYRGKLDAFLINHDKLFSVLEVKTTGSKWVHEAMFRNSGQGIGYSAIVDAIASRLGLQQKESFPIHYPVYMTHQKEWKHFPFTKSKSSHANWLRHLLRTVQHVAEYAEDGYFPMHGQNCFHYSRPCRFFEQCEMSNKFLVGEKPAVKEDREGDYQFHFSLDELIEAQLAKQLSHP